LTASGALPYRARAEIECDFQFQPNPGLASKRPRQSQQAEWAFVATAERGRNGRHDPDECRCLCGSLVARRVPDGVELKCRRCKRTVVIPLLDLVQHASAHAPEATR